MEEENQAILMSLELAVVRPWRRHREMTDYDALRAYEAAFRYYRAEERGQRPRLPELAGLDAELFEALAAACEVHLGRRPDPVPAKTPIKPVPVGTLLECLRKVIKSVPRHTEVSGRQGYLRFVHQFLPS